MHLQKIVFILLMPLFVIGCSDESSDEDVVFKLSISEITANSATVMVMHNATNRDAYYGFAVEGVVSDVQSEINYFLSHTDSNKLIEAVHYQRKSVFQVRGLKPEKTFTYIIFGMNEDGLIYGKPASVEFKTERSNMVATENPNWVIKYKGHVVYNDNDYSLISVSLNGEVEERFFLATYSLEFASSFDRVENLITYAANEFIEEKTKVSDYWLETSQVRTEGTYFYRYLQEGDYVSYAIGLNADGLPTGHYVTTGTYHVYWSGYRSSTSGTNGSRLYINGSAYGNAQTSFNSGSGLTNTQQVHLSGVSLAKDDVITVYARSRGNNYYMYIMNLIIIEA